MSHPPCRLLVLLQLMVLLVATVAWPLPAWAASLSAYYPFSGNANDASGNGHDGTVIDATSAPDRFGTPDSAFSFVGSTGGIQVPDSGPGLDLVGDFSIVLWLKPTSSTGGWILHKHVSGNNNDGSWWLAMFPDATLHFEATPHFDASAPTSNPLPLSTWTHVALTYNATTDAWNYYINGASDRSGTLDLTIADTSLPLLIGIRDDGLAPFHGALDDIRLYHGVLTPTEVQELYAAVPEPGTLLLLASGVVGLGAWRMRKT